MANKITVTSLGTTANVNATPDSARYYSDKSKEWAIGEKLIDNTDYSSKYYANESKKQADISTAKTTEVIESGNTAVTNIENARDNAITDITNQESLSVDNVNAAGATQVANVNSAGTTQINLAKEQVTLATNQANIATEQATIATNKASEVVASGNEALSNIDTAKTGAITDITDLKNTSVSNITTAKNSAISTITTQETTSKNNVIATGNAQVERVNLTGVDNRTPIFTKSEIGTNESVYQNIYDLKHSTFDKSKFTVVGSPTITDDGVASGLTTSSTIKPPAPYNTTGFLNVTKSWDITIKIQYLSADIHCRGLLLHYQFPLIGCIGINATKVGLWGKPTGGAEGDITIETLANLGISDGDFVNVRVTFDVGTLTYTLYASKNDEPLSFRKSVVKTGNLEVASTNQEVKFACYDGGGYRHDFEGSLDLKKFSITVDGKEVFSGNKTGIDVINEIEIPYTLSKTGSKIVDVAYRDRVIDLYEQEGKAGYYTIDEENKNFTLPMGEIYGMIGQRSLISSTVTETNRVDIYSDKTCLICGNVATAGTINLPIELVNNNYFITLSTSTKTATSFTTTATGDYILIGKVI